MAALKKKKQKHISPEGNYCVALVAPATWEDEKVT
jgi:hypothetical protein